MVDWIQEKIKAQGFIMVFDRRLILLILLDY
jgi:hypothetical protein